MQLPTPDQEYPSAIWTPFHDCAHPRERLTFTGHFPEENYALSVFNANCLQCGTSWTQRDDNAPWSQLMEKLANGEFGVVSFKDPEISGKVDRRRRLRYDQILDDAYGSCNPIFDGPPLKPFD